MAMSEETISGKHVPGTDAPAEKIFNFPFTTDAETREFIKYHGRLMFIIRGFPGTCKYRLSLLLQNCYPSAILCSADSYFENHFVNRKRTPETLKMSHEFCEKRVIEECENGSHPIIVQNSHIKLWEAKPYVQAAAKYGYTVIMAVTSRKFYIDAKILSKTNRKGLPLEYFVMRLKQWREYVPLYLGWFLKPDDASFLLNQGKEALISLTGDGKFCKVFDAYCEEEILQYFKAKATLLCIASYCGSRADKRKLYLSPVLQEAYGKCFEISVQGFLISKSFLLAVVALYPESKCLLSKRDKDSKGNVDHVVALENTDINYTLDGVTLFETKCDFKKHIVKESDWEENEEMNIRDLSIIVLGEANENASLIVDAHQFVSAAFSDMASESHMVQFSELLEFDNGTQYARLENDMWFVQAPKKLQVKTLFTGLYN